MVAAIYYGMGSDFPLEMLVTIILEEQDVKTKMTLKHIGVPSGTMSEMTGQGWNESFDKLDKTLKELK